jgi:uncharacterized membrane protein YdbT with pleckstrin-like domain
VTSATAEAEYFSHVPFPRKLLYEGEEIVLDLKPHWWFMAKSAAVVVLAITFGIVALWLSGGHDGSVLDVLNALVAVAVVVALGYLVRAYLKWINTNFVLTTDRLVFRQGVVAKKGIEIPLERINTVFFNQTVFERMLGAGDLSIESGGESGKETFSNVRRPHLVQNEIYRQMEDNQSRMYGSGKYAQPMPMPTPVVADARGGEPTIPEQIEHLYELAKKGVISAAEYDAKKTELLKRL